MVQKPNDLVPTELDIALDLAQEYQQNISEASRIHKQ